MQLVDPLWCHYLYTQRNKYQKRDPAKDVQAVRRFNPGVNMHHYFSYWYANKCYYVMAATPIILSHAWSGVTDVTSPSRATQSACKERLKLLSEPLAWPLVLECPDKNDGCTWFHVVDNVEQRFLVIDSHGNANLIGNNVYSFGDFIVNTPNTSQCYKVCPAYVDSSKYS